MSNKTEFNLPLRCMRRLTQHDFSEPFYIQIKSTNRAKEEKLIKTTLNKARIISNKIDNILQIDPTINKYQINIPIKTSSKHDLIEINDFEELINLFLKSTEDKIEISKGKLISFDIIRLILNDSEIYDQNISINNIQEAISFLSTEFHLQSIKYISDHFLEFTETGQLSKLDEKIVEEIIDSYFSKEKENGQNFFKEVKQIFSIMTENKEDTNLIIYFLLNIDYQNYDKKMRNFIAYHLSDEIVNNELGLIMRKFQQILLNDNTKEIKESIIECQYNGNDFYGIIAHLKEKFGYDLIKKEILTLSDPEIPTAAGSIENLIKYDNNDDLYYHNQGSGSAKKNEGWFEIDFRERKINVKSFTIKTSKSNYAAPKSWKIVGSNDRTNWDILCHQVNNSNLKGDSKQYRFECNDNNNNNYYRFIRYVQEDSWNKTFQYNLTLSRIELFGSILSIKT